jgi:hypothetical protein
MPTYNDATLITTPGPIVDGSPSGHPLLVFPTIIWSYGGPGSNCYVSETMISSFLETSVVGADSWFESSWSMRKAAMLEATRDIDVKQYVGGRYYYDQRLKFPRQLNLSFPWNRTGASSTVFSVTMLRMEEDVKRATCWQALHLLRSRGRNRHLEAIASGIRSRSSSAGPTSESLTYARNISRLAPEAIALLTEWTTSRRAVRG